MKLKHMIMLVMALAICGILSIEALAQDNRLEASLERDKVYMGNPVYLYVTFTGAQNVQRPDGPPPINGVSVTYVGASTQMSIVNGKVSQSVTHTYLVVSREGGKFTIGPFTVLHDGARYTSNTVVLVSSGVPSQSRPSSPQAAPYDPSANRRIEDINNNDVFLKIEVPKRSVYINEKLPVSVSLYVGQVKVKNIEYPFYPHEGFSAGELERPTRSGRNVNGRSYDTLTFEQDLFAIKEGNYLIGPASLNCTVLVKKGAAQTSRFSIDDFFGGNLGYTTYSIKVESEPINVKILPFPETSKPAGFQGAVGDFNMSVYVKPPNVKVGDPIVVTMTITGNGNLDTVTSPVIAIDDNFKTYEATVTRDEGKKVYEQILIPKTHKITEVPEVSLSFLNPRTGRYETVKKGPFPITVIARPDSGDGVKVMSVPGEIGSRLYPKEELGMDIVHIKERSGPFRERDRELYHNKVFLFGQMIPLLGLAFFYASYRKKERMLTDKRYARSMKAPKAARKGLAKARSFLDKGEVSLFYDEVFKTLQSYLSGKFNIAIGNITARTSEERLRVFGCEDEIIEMLNEVFSACERARYASSETGGEEPQKVFLMVKKIIDRVERIRI
ncbi:MAG: BatD family protein [Candidatus Omnitrophota bacterium]